MVICVLKTVICWIILGLVGTNLVGFFVRGLHMVRPLQKSTKRVYELMPGLRKMDTTGFSGMVQRTLRWNSFVNIVAGIACIAYPLILFWWLGWQVSIAALILMLARLPDLIFELRTGIKVNRKSAPYKPIYIIGMGLTWLALALVWWGICYSPKTAVAEKSAGSNTHDKIEANVDGFFVGIGRYTEAIRLSYTFKVSKDKEHDLIKFATLLTESKNRLSNCDRELMNSIYDEWGDVIHEKFIASIEQYLSGLSMDDFKKAETLRQEAISWIEKNMTPLVKRLEDKYGINMNESPNGI